MCQKDEIILTILLVLTSYCFQAKGQICETTICEYDFDIRWSQTMTYFDGKRGYAVGLNGSELEIIESGYRSKQSDPFIGTIVAPSDVNIGDGTPRDVIVINGKYPGPTIEVLEGAQVVVRVINHLKLEAVTLHWHGLHMLDTPFMDGAAFITQCPIGPGQSFTYRFKADPGGTHWYHTHLHQQLVAGASGMLIVHREKPSIPQLNVAVSDWFSSLPAAFDYTSPYISGGIKSGGIDVYNPNEKRYFSHDNSEVATVRFVSALINGRGRLNQNDLFPLTEFFVTAGKNYRFRLVNMAIEFFYEISVDDHLLQIVALDGQDVLPIAVDSFIVGAGERVDFEIKADHQVSSYWFRARTLSYGLGQYPAVEEVFQEVKAALRYSGSPSQGDPRSQPRECSTTAPCRVYGCPWLGYKAGTNKICFGLEDAKSLHTPPDEYGLNDHVDNVEEHFFNFAYGYGSSVNARKFVEPEVPLLGQKAPSIPHACKAEDCVKGCACTNILDLAVQRPIQLVLTNFDAPGGASGHHSVHLHGYNFAVVKVGYPDYNLTTGFRGDKNSDLRCDDSICSKLSWISPPQGLNLANPPLKDTVVVPVGGYIIARLKTKNPGYWLFHCHQVTHHIEGMAMVINVAKEDHPLLPPGFPTCEHFEFTNQQYVDYISGNEKPTQGYKKTYELTTFQLIAAAIGLVVGGLLLGILGMVICKKCCRDKKVIHL